MSATVRQIELNRDHPLRWTVDQYHALIERGMIEEGAPYELLDGLILRKDRAKVGGDPMTVGPDHSTVVRRLARLDQKLSELGCFIQTQQPVTLSSTSEPEPDGAIIRGTIDSYKSKHPGANDILGIIEVADSSLHRDRTTKLRIYAQAGVPHYVILNLADRVAEVYTDPMPQADRYGTAHTLAPDAALNLPTPQGPHPVRVGELLP